MKLNMSSHSRRCIWIKLQCVIVRRQWGISSMTVLAAQLTSTIVFVLLLLLAINALSAERREEEGQGGADQTWGRVTISSSPVHTKAVFISPKLQEHASLHFLYQHLLRQLQLKCAKCAKSFEMFHTTQQNPQDIQHRESLIPLRTGSYVTLNR